MASGRLRNIDRPNGGAWLMMFVENAMATTVDSSKKYVCERYAPFEAWPNQRRGPLFVDDGWLKSERLGCDSHGFFNTGNE